VLTDVIGKIKDDLIVGLIVQDLTGRRLLVVIALEFAETDHHRVMIATVVTIPIIVDAGEDLREETVHTEEAIPGRVMIVTAWTTIPRQQETSR